MAALVINSIKKAEKVTGYASDATTWISHLEKGATDARDKRGSKMKPTSDRPTNFTTTTTTN